MPLKPERKGGRPAGQPNRRTEAIGATLDASHSRVTRALLDEVIPDRQLAQLLWKLALEGDGKVASYLADRKWGRVKYELEHQAPEQKTLVLMMGRTSEEHYKAMQEFQYGPLGSEMNRPQIESGPRTIDVTEALEGDAGEHGAPGESSNESR